jgi:hypothetical protein
VAAPLPTRLDPPASHDRVLTLRRRRSRRWRWIAGILIALLVAIAIAAHEIIVHAEPMLRARVIATLSSRFQGRVELSGLHVSVANGLQVSGDGLQIYGATDPNPTEAGVQPLLEIQEFRFRTSLRSLLYVPMHVETVFVKGMTLNIPPREDRKQVQASGWKQKIKVNIVVDRFVCEQTRLVINTLKPGHQPLEFEIGDLTIKDVGSGQPLSFDATLVNPKPLGDVKSTGQFGPFDSASPRATPLQGSYSFTHADLGTLKGIAGILSSTGSYSGSLGQIKVEGNTDTPDFRLAVAGRPVPLHIDFHATVDGTDGDTYLDPVEARLLHSTFTAKGKIVRTEQPKGHDIELDVVLDKARIEDLLKLGLRTDPPIMTGPIEMKANLSLPPGDPDVANRLKLEGTFRVPRAVFTNHKLQDRINSLSMRSRGKAKLAEEQAEDHTDTNVPSDISGTFKLADAVFAFSQLHFLVPGTQADAEGQYSLDGNTFDFHGTLRLDARLSQMTTGWRSILLKPVDPFFEKHGAGTEVPFKITGTRDEPHLGLDFGRNQKDQPDPGQGKKDQPKMSN